MSNALTIASVTAVLKRHLENALIVDGVAASIGGEVIVSALPPDRIATGADERAQLNLFLWQITPNIGLVRTSQLESKGSNERRLWLDLHYLLSAYGTRDFQGDILLGHAVYVLHGISLAPDAQRQARSAFVAAHMASSAPDTVIQTIADLGDQLDQISISQQFLGMEEMAKIWSATQAHYRPSAAYKVSFVLMDVPHEDDRI